VHVDLQRGEHVEQGELVVAQRLGDLVAHPQLRQPQERGLPQGEHLQPQIGFPGAASSSSSSARLAPLVSRSAIRRCVSRIVLRRTSVGWAVSTGLTSTRRSTAATASAGRADAPERADRMAEGAGTRWRADAAVMTSPARLVHVLGDVGEQREPAEGAYDVHGDVDVDTVEQPAEFARVRAAGAASPVTAWRTRSTSS
jgi:hypothetical protein